MTEGTWQPIRLDESAWLEQNLNDFKQRVPQFYDAIDEARAYIEKLEILPLGPDQYACRDRETNEEIYPAETFTQYLSELHKRGQWFIERGVKQIWIAGAGFGYLATHLHDLIEGQPDSGLFLLENRPEILLAQFALFDCRPLMRSSQVIWAVSPSLTTQALQTIDEEGLYYASPQQMTILPERLMNSEEQALYRAIITDFNVKLPSRERSLQNQQAVFNRRMNEKPNLEDGVVWSFANRRAYAHTPLLRSLMQGFETLGWDSALLETDESFTLRYQLGEHLVMNRPDILLFFNAASQDYIAKNLNRPRVTFLLDHPRYFWSATERESLGINDCVFSMDRDYQNYFDQGDALVFRFLPAFPSFHRDAEVVEELKAPIVFVGSHTPVSQMLEEVPLQIREEIEALAGHMIEQPGMSIRERLETVRPSDYAIAILRKVTEIYIQNMGRRFESDDAKLDYYLYALSNAIKRERFTRPLLDLGLVIYGSRSWLGVLGDQYADRYKGWVSADRLPELYASAEVCINIHSLQCPTCLNSRDFDVLQAGGCLASDYVPDMDEGLVTPGEDLVCAKSPEQFREAVESLLANPERRSALREQGRETCRQKHQTHHRAVQILETVRNHWPAEPD